MSATRDLDLQLSDALNSVPKAVATGIVDMSSGLLLSIKTTSDHPAQVFDFLAAATKDLYEGENVTAIENIFKEARGQQGSKERYFKEIIIYSTNLLHYFARVPDNERIVFAVICPVNVSIGMFLVKAREAASKIEF